MKKNITKVTVLILALISIYLLAACDETVDNTDSTQEANIQEDVNEEVNIQVAVNEEVNEEVNAEVTSDNLIAFDLNKLKDLEGKNILIVDLYNEIADLAITNGWNADELTVEELGAVNNILIINNSVLTDQTGITDSDLDELLSATDTMTLELDTNIRERVSVPYIVAD